MLNVAVIGLGNMGWHHARIYSELSSCNLVAVADLNAELSQKAVAKYRVRAYSEYQEMLAKEKLDAISIVVPTSLHHAVAMDCIQAKVPILIEKPIASTREEGKAIIAAAKANKVPVMIGHIERFNPAVQKLKELIVSNKLDRITSIVARRVGIYPPQIKDANVIVDIAVHDIDICNYLLGRPPVTIYAKAGKALNSERADFASLFLDYGDTETFIQVNWITPVKIRELNVTAINGYAELNYLTQKLKLYESNYQRTFDSFGDFVVKFGTPNIQDLNIQTAEPLKLELDAFLTNLKKGAPMPVTAEDGLLALDIALKAIESYQLNKIVEVNNDL
ncbi:Gfo/Idh/MocA family oxidoreductase [candidate division KSB1 bacterium]|nr:Gfo/Idh/MocA family oxidoreductase [candidate division KSB1 bacterium]